jgi:hypothetical protein
MSCATWRRAHFAAAALGATGQPARPARSQRARHDPRRSEPPVARSTASYRGPEDPPPPAPPPLGGEDAGVADAPGAAAAEVLALTALLPPRVRALLEARPDLPALVEVVLDLGRPPLARFAGAEEARLAEAPVERADLDAALAACGDFGGDNRAGIDATLHRISAIRNRRGVVVGLTCRVGRAVRGSAAMAADLALAGRSILLLGRPGVGKTTAIRELSRLLADEALRRVVIVDTSNEIGGDGDVPHPGIGGARRMQVARPEEQHRVMIEAVENHMPEVRSAASLSCQSKQKTANQPTNHSLTTTEMKIAGRGHRRDRDRGRGARGADDRAARRPADRDRARDGARQRDQEPGAGRPRRRHRERHARRRGGAPARRPEERARARGAADLRRLRRDGRP